MVWPFFKKKQTNNFILSVLGVFFHVFGRNEEVLHVFCSSIAVLKIPQIARSGFWFFWGGFFGFWFFFPASERSMLRQIRVHLLRMIQRRCESEIHQHVRVNVL